MLQEKKEKIHPVKKATLWSGFYLFILSSVIKRKIH